MITINIDSKVPEFFRALQKKSSVIPFEKFISSKIPEIFSEREVLLLKDSLKESKYSISIDIKIPIFGQNIFFEGESMPLTDFDVQSIDENSFTTKISLLDGYIYSNDGTRLSHVSKMFHVKTIISKLEIQNLINWLIENDFTAEYNEILSQNDIEHELKTYNAWIKHNINLLNQK